MKSINSINIENIKGIEKLTFSATINPYMPNFLVAPNGFGKSSLATTFKSLNRDRLKVEEKNYHKGNPELEYLLEIEITNDDNSKTTLTANKDKNEISKIFDIEVIKSLLKPEANYRKIQGNHITSPTIEVENIYIVENIPEKFELPYQITKFRNSISDNRQIWVDLSGLLINPQFLTRLSNLNILDKFDLVKHQKFINDYKIIVKNLSGKKDEIINELNLHHLDILNNEFVNQIVTLLERFQNKSKAENILEAIQLIELYKSNKNDFYKLFNYNQYRIQKERILTLFNSFKATWKNIQPKEINITRKIKKKTVIVQKNLGIEFPKATDISNGERDVISFIGCLLKTQSNFRGKPTILIIDEVFDYLDDANLLAVQFYITKFIEFFQKREIQFFPMILTHLNPYYFKNYFFSKQKVHYLLSWKGAVDRGIENIVISRNNTKTKTYEDTISSYFLHFNPADFNIENDAKSEFTIQKLGNVNEQLCNSGEFKKSVLKYFDNYVSGKKNYDPISVCIACRILVEQNIYNQLPAELQNDFLETHTTVAKLDFARENTDIIIPEIYYFLGTLYNELLHIRKNNDNSSPIYLKLNNITIKEMIKQLKNNN
ncbi:hypothetical protein [Chryseobacterium luquanense]|uniref:Rad50/SbcC-type AAA domain-containing protein n=1 Tax=Chryseobacterium luquanense TaxID=2983766 RepID=A0ABT3Y788_9FLAO|nr:hypothetical protein [Chryseobacterium luquanense]MCX8533972.1 hypothetical protein [Chryseobacterium luquanense]